MKLRILTPVLVLLVGLSAPAFAGTTPEAHEYLQRLFTLVEQQPIRAGYVVALQGTEEGMQIEATIRGELLQSGSDRYVNDLEMRVKMPTMGDTPMEMTSRQVSDGTTLWTETYISTMGMNQVGKIALSDLAEIQGKASGLDIGESSIYMDPMSQLEMIVAAFEVDVLEVADGLVKLSMAPTEDTLAKLGETGEKEISGVLVLRESDAVPVSATVTFGGTMNVEILYESFELLADEDVPEGAFVYTPEPGTEVVDLGPLLKSRM